MKDTRKALTNLNKDLRKEKQIVPIQFSSFLDIAAKEPNLIFRDIFQLFHDMMHYYVPKGFNEESIGLVNYDFSKLLTQDVDVPFFTDTLLSNRLMCLADGFKKGLQSNRILLFEGPPGSGKSIFLDNLIRKFEVFTKIPEGIMYETLWRLDTKTFGGLEHKINDQSYLDVPCPNHDHPILQIPRAYRKKFLDELIEDGEFKKRLFKEKEYEWIFKSNACSICASIYHKLIEKLKNPEKVLGMLCAQHFQFNRQLGEGVSIFNSQDPVSKKPHTNKFLQDKLSELLKGSDAVEYVFSDFAKTNNGIFALMDIKGNNCLRLKELYGIASDGVHKVDHLEEYIHSLFIGLINPEDTQEYKEHPSFKDRVVTVKVPYVLDYNTEIEIYKSKFSGDLKSHFLPRVLENFAKLVISSRLNPDSETLRDWIDKPEQYQEYLDKNQLLLKIELYTGHVPAWLSEEDRKKFNSKTRKKLIAESELEGFRGFSGRKSIEILNYFLLQYSKPDKPITMDMLNSLFLRRYGLKKTIPPGFLESIIRMYDFDVLEEVKESLYHYNENQISRDIQNYLYAVNFEPDSKERCTYTGDVIEITEDFFYNIERILFPDPAINSFYAEEFRKDVQKTYVSKTLATEIGIEKKTITETEQYKALFKKYLHNAKEVVLLPLTENDNFRRAIQDYRTSSFDTYDKRLQQDVSLLVENLQNKFGYTEKGAKQVCIYVLDKDLAREFGRGLKKRRSRDPFGNGYK